MSYEIEVTESHLKDLNIILRSLDVDITSLKRSHVLRRVRTRVMRVGKRTLDEYIVYLRGSEEEKNLLKHAFSINVTHFFRNQDTFELIKKEVLPLLARGTNRIKIWSAGCADGAEPYSLAILCHQIGLRPDRVTITATDYNNNSLEMARAGVYHESYLKETPRDIKAKYFSPGPTPETVQVDLMLRQYIDLKRHNLITDHPLGRGMFDMVVCRNVLIYFTREQHEPIYKSFYEALRPDGVFVLGRSEVLSANWRDRFTIYNSHHRISTKIKG